MVMTTDTSTEMSAGPGLLLKNSDVLLASLSHLARSEFQLPVCCLGMVPYLNSSVGQSTRQSLLVHREDSSCQHLLPLETLWEAGEIHASKTDCLHPVLLGSEICGVWVSQPGERTCSRGRDAFRRLFQVYYLRYWCYHASIRHFPEQTNIVILGDDPELLTAVQRIERCARSNLPVLLTGETGTGKELWARAIHLRSDRAGMPFQPVNCAHLWDDSLSMSNLFGHARGSFTGASDNRAGYLKSAHKGTLFLDEIESLSMPMQAALLRTLESGEIQPVGEDAPCQVDLRVVAATNEHLETLLQRKEFRKDLYYRLKGHTITLPPLRQRNPRDIDQMVRYKLSALNTATGSTKHLDWEKVLPALHRYPWPGNVRELLHTVSAAYYESEDRQSITVEDFPEEIREFDDSDLPVEQSDVVYTLFNCLTRKGESFWAVVHKPYLNRDLNRSQVHQLIRMGMKGADTFKTLATLFNIPDHQYQKFMDFLRHHRLHH